MTIHRDQVFELCRIIAPRFQLDPLLGLAVCVQEAEKDSSNPAIFRADVARLEQRFYRRYIEPMNYATTTEVLLSASYGLPQMMGQSLVELRWFEKDFTQQSVEYKNLHVEPMSETNVPKAINRYLVQASEQVETMCEWLARKRQIVGDKEAVFLLAYNGGGNRRYANEVLAKRDALKKIYGG